MTQFLADESCDALIVRTLRKLGYDVTYIAEIAPSMADNNILSQGNQQQRIIITEDHDFCELVYRDRQESYGVVLVRIPVPSRLRKADRITDLVRNHSNELVGAMTTLKLNTFKIKPIRREIG
jgi:uncharacterized protein with PIN domain